MEIRTGIDKIPIIKFDSNKYTHILPVTKYQFERYIWEMAPDIDYDMILQANSRISPNEVSRQNIKSLFITNISFNEAIGFANYLGGRLPTVNEIDDIYNLIRTWEVKDLSQITNPDMDIRYLNAREKILNIFSNSKIADFIEILNINELCSRMSFPPYKPIYARHIKGGSSHIVGDDALNTKVKDAGFRVIIE